MASEYSLSPSILTPCSELLQHLPDEFFSHSGFISLYHSERQLLSMVRVISRETLLDQLKLFIDILALFSSTPLLLCLPLCTASLPQTPLLMGTAIDSPKGAFRHFLSWNIASSALYSATKENSNRRKTNKVFWKHPNTLCHCCFG